MARNRPIILGQRYREAQPRAFGRPGQEWIVEALFTGTDGMEYAGLARASNPSERKTLSLAVLGDRRQFTLIERGEPDEKPAQPLE
jgi:hypothetical protein